MKIEQAANLEKHSNATLAEVTDSIYIEAATSDNTRAAYQSDIRHYLSNGGDLPASPQGIESYLKTCATDLRTTTIERRVYALRQWHRLKGVDDPTKHPLVQKTLKGIKRLHGKPANEARAILIDEVDMVSNDLKEKDTVLAKRDRALFLLEFFGAFRRSEVVNLNWEQAEFVEEGLVIALLRNKTDQYGEGQKRFIPFGNEARCPVQALIEWRKASNQWSGAIFRRLSKTGNILAQPITGRYWNTRFKVICKEAGLSRLEKLSTHSLRRGFATAVSRKGAGLKAIMEHGSWKSTATVLKYIEEGRQFSDSAVRLLYDF